MTRGRLVAFEGLDQSGKQTQALRLRQALEAAGLSVVSFDFPDYATPLGTEIGARLRGERTFPPDCLQLLYVANRCEYLAKIDLWVRTGGVVVCDRYRASSIAYGFSPRVAGSKPRRHTKRASLSRNATASSMAASSVAGVMLSSMKAGFSPAM